MRGLIGVGVVKRSWRNFHQKDRIEWGRARKERGRARTRNPGVSVNVARVKEEKSLSGNGAGNPV